MRTEGNTLTELETSLLMTLTYADLFEYPMTLEELHEGLFSPREVSLTEVAAALHETPRLAALVRRKDGYYFLEGHSDRVETRRRREIVHQCLMGRAALYVSALAGLPCVDSVHVSGGNALGAPADRDVDLFIVAKPGFTWTTFLASWVLKHALGLRGLICVNYVADREHTSLPEQDLFTAHQIITLRSPVVGRGSAGVKAANPWAREFFANAYAQVQAGAAPRPASRLEALFAGFASPLERILEGLFTLKWTLEGRFPAAGMRLDPWRVKAHHADHLSETITRFDRAWRRQMEKADAMAEYLAVR